jgi:hypothetical protein
LFIEKIKSNLGSMHRTLIDFKYDIHDLGPNILAVSSNEPASREIRALIDAQFESPPSGDA